MNKLDEIRIKVTNYEVTVDNYRAVTSLPMDDPVSLDAHGRFADALADIHNMPQLRYLLTIAESAQRLYAASAPISSTIGIALTDDQQAFFEALGDLARALEGLE